MGLFDNFKKVDVRSLENRNIPVSADNFLHLMGWDDLNSSSGVVVNVENALGVSNERGRFPTMQIEFQQLKSATVATRFGRDDIFLPTTATLQKASSSLSAKKAKQKI